MKVKNNVGAVVPFVPAWGFMRDTERQENGFHDDGHREEGNQWGRDGIPITEHWFLLMEALQQ